MSEPTPPRPKPKDPFGPPLEHNQVREVFRRLGTRPQAEQEAFVSKINWNLLDESSEYRLVGWLLDNLRSPDAPRQAYVVALLNKLPHHKRARHAPRFRALMETLSPTLRTQVADAFGPILGGAPKPSKAKGKPPAPAPVAKAEPPTPKEATGDDLAKLKDFFGKFGSAK